MKTERILIFTDVNKQSQFETEVENVQHEAERLISTFEAFQPWDRINSIDQFEDLCSDPVNAMDQTLIAHSGINLTATGGKLPAASMIAKLLDINYDDYIAILTGKKVSDTCKPCKAKAKIIKTGSGVLSYSSYRQYSSYLAWTDNKFEINEDLVSEKKETFNFYAETENQIQTAHFWYNACDMLNQLSKRGLLGELNAFSKLLHPRITFSYQAGRLAVDLQSLIFELQSIKN